jgi:Dehydrogenases (flavoproteins)
LKKYDCIIIGCGPAGMSAAYHLFRNGITNICIIEKNNENYHKPCAGLITKKGNKLLLEMKIDLKKESDYFEMNDINIFYKNNKSFKINTKEYSWLASKYPNRENFDDLLKDKIKKLGVPCFYNMNIINIEENEVITKNKTFKYKNIIFADGVNGYSKKYNKKDKLKNFSLEVVVKNTNISNKNFVNLYFGISKKGYAWYGNTGKNISIGLTDEYNKKINYINLLKDFSKTLGYEINNKDIKGAYFPCGPKKNVTYGNNTYIIGDAAGLTDPLTAEGIYYSLITAKYAALAIARGDINYYINKVKPITNNFKFINKSRNLFYNKFISKFLWNKFSKKHSDFVSFAWQNVVIEGKYKYKDILKYHKDYKNSKKNKS